MRNKKGQGISEYAIIVGLVGTALLAMSLHFQRGIQTIIKRPADYLGGFGSGNFTPQRIQEMAIEAEGENTVSYNVTATTSPVIENVTVEIIPGVPVLFPVPLPQKQVTALPGGSRRLEAWEGTNTTTDSESYQEFKYD